ncbi:MULTISPECIES: hypothetical protein [unclassified Rhodococcus (in: high G+C Gram-positive bacteria)]|uniref:hypothetical protein n=1 Tax=unclassified Rhodococcus (in: high G+C Gram-positive bacteria) TaxID=192944 RepID=UPI00096A93EF|nr:MULTISPECIES: hypothetical protein [unclassified Rhodococcus (in: high G+C Gram-positive bacteria)]
MTKEASQSGRAPVSLERADLLDADYLMIYAHGSDQEKLSAAIPGFADLRAVRSGAVTYADTEKVLAFYSPGLLSLTWGIDGIVPQLSKAAAVS